MMYADIVDLRGGCFLVHTHNNMFYMQLSYISEYPLSYPSETVLHRKRLKCIQRKSTLNDGPLCGENLSKLWLIFVTNVFTSIISDAGWRHNEDADCHHYHFHHLPDSRNDQYDYPFNSRHSSKMWDTTLLFMSTRKHLGFHQLNHKYSCIYNIQPKISSYTAQ